MSKPRYELTITLTAHEGGTAITWAQEFEDSAVAARIKHIVEPANEQNLERLEAVLAKRRLGRSAQPYPPRIHAIVRKALGDMFRALGEEFWRAQGAGNVGANMASAFEKFSAGEALDYDVVEQSPDSFEVNVTGCRYAQFYKELGVPELGFLLVCSLDFPMAAGFGPDVKLTRTQTIMQGASHCDFRYTRIKPKGE